MTTDLSCWASMETVPRLRMLWLHHGCVSINSFPTIFWIFISNISKAQGWRSGENTRLPPMRPGFKPRCWYVDWVCCWFSAPRGFSPGTPVFPSHQNPTFPNSNLTRNQVDEVPLRGCATSKSLLFLDIISEFPSSSFPKRVQVRNFCNDSQVYFPFENWYS